MDKIKIVFVLDRLDVGGAEKQALELIRKLDRTCFVPHVLSLRDHGSIETIIEECEVPLKCLDVSPSDGEVHSKFHPASYIKACRLLGDMIRYFRQESPHIVQSYLTAGNIFGSLAAKIAGVPVIITGRRSIVDERYIRFPKFPDQWFLALSNIWATAIIANSFTVKAQCLQRKRFVTEEMIQVVYNGIDLARFTHPKKASVSETSIGLSEEALVIGVIATLHPRKGHQNVIKAIPRVLQKFPNAMFVLVGRDAGIQNTLETFAEELQIRDSILFTGERDDIPEILSMLDVQVSSSYTEGLSNAIIEGMAAGKPVVATDIGGNSELIVDGETGLIIPPGNPIALADAIIQMLSDKRKREQMGAAGRRRVETLFQLEHMIRNTERVYKHLVRAYPNNSI